MPNFSKLPSLLTLTALLSILLPSTADAGFFDGCSFMKKKDKPAWVSTGWKKSGYYYGVGQSGERKTEQEQKKASEQSALSDLASKISVTVKSSLTGEISEVKGRSKSSMEQSIKLITQTDVQQSLRDWNREDLWLDRDKCILYTLVTISKSTVRDIQREMAIKAKFAAMLKSYERGLGANKVAGAKNQLKELSDAGSLLDEIDFKYLPKERRKSYYQTRIASAIKRLNKKIDYSSARILVAPLSVGKKFSPKIIDMVISHIKSSSKNADDLRGECSSIKECIAVANSGGFSRVAIVKLTKKVVQGNLGAYAGTMTVVVTLYGVESGKSVRKPVTLFAQIISWDKESLDWSLAVNKIIKSKKFRGILG